MRPVYRPFRAGLRKQRGERRCSVSGRIDYKAVALEAVDLLCMIGFSGLHESRRREVWQRALDLDRRLHPDREPVTVWTEEEGDISPPRRGSVNVKTISDENGDAA